MHTSEILTCLQISSNNSDLDEIEQVQTFKFLQERFNGVYNDLERLFPEESELEDFEPHGDEEGLINFLKSQYLTNGKTNERVNSAMEQIADVLKVQHHWQHKMDFGQFRLFEMSTEGKSDEIQKAFDQMKKALAKRRQNGKISQEH